MDDRTQKPQADQVAGEADFTTATDGTPLSDQLDEESNFEHTLSKPIEAHGETLSKLTWREPTGGDIERAGVPITMDFFGEKPSLTFNEKKMSAMISTLCQIPPSSVRQLTAGDWNAIAWKLVRFHASDGGLIPPEDVVLACYEFAHFYHLDPQVFLDKNMSDLGRSRYWTARLTQRIREAQEAAESDG